MLSGALKNHSVHNRCSLLRHNSGLKSIDQLVGMGRYPRLSGALKTLARGVKPRLGEQGRESTSRSESTFMQKTCEIIRADSVDRRMNTYPRSKPNQWSLQRRAQPTRRNSVKRWWFRGDHQPRKRCARDWAKRWWVVFMVTTTPVHGETK